MVVPPSINSSPHRRTPDRAAHRGDQLEEQPRPVGERTAVVVVTPVRGRRQEAPHDRAVRALELDAVEPALRAALGHVGVAGHDRRDLPVVHRLRDLAEERVGDRRGRPHRQARVHRRRLAAVVVDLGEDRRAVAVHGLGDAPVARQDVGVEAVDELLVGPVGGVGRVLLGDDEPGTALRPLGVVGRVLLGGPAALGVVGEVRAEHDAVLHRHRPDPERRPEEALGHRRTPVWRAPVHGRRASTHVKRDIRAITVPSPRRRRRHGDPRARPRGRCGARRCRPPAGAPRRTGSTTSGRAGRTPRRRRGPRGSSGAPR